MRSQASAKFVDFPAFLRALRAFEDAEAEMLDQDGGSNGSRETDLHDGLDCSVSRSYVRENAIK